MEPAISAGERRQLGDLGPRLVRAGRGLGVLGLVLTVGLALLQGPKALLQAWVINVCFFLSLALGSLFFVLIHHLTRAGWSTAVRRLAEAVAANTQLLAVLFVPLLVWILWFDAGPLYPWLHPGGDPLLEGKQAYLNVPFFVVRVLIYFTAWILISRFYFRHSVAQDASGDVEFTHRLQRLGPLSMLVFALTLTFFAFDVLMSLNPHWYSTIFGVYYFAGAAGAFFAMMAGVLLFLQSRGLLTESVTAEHYHDLGKFMFAFVVFWAYIAYSQYMLIWYGNIPEETIWFHHRQQGSWAAVSLLLVFGHFVGPFLFLMSRHIKRRRGTLLAGAIWMLFIHWVDIFWLVKPGAGVLQVNLYLIDATCFLGLGGFFVAEVARRLMDCALIPEKDPRLVESLAFEND